MCTRSCAMKDDSERGSGPNPNLSRADPRFSVLINRASCGGVEGNDSFSQRYTI